MLASLVSGQDQNAITKAIAEFTGLEEGSSGSVLGILTSIIMGTIANHQSERAPSTRMASLTFSPAKRTILQLHYPLVSSACLAAQTLIRLIAP
jgi:hypothetical protein